MLNFKQIYKFYFNIVWLVFHSVKPSYYRTAIISDYTRIYMHFVCLRFVQQITMKTFHSMLENNTSAQLIKVHGDFFYNPLRLALTGS